MLDVVLEIGINSLFFWMGWFAHKRAVRNPYRWACDEEGCQFSCSANYWEGVMKIADNHKRGSHNVY